MPRELSFFICFLLLMFSSATYANSTQPNDPRRATWQAKFEAVASVGRRVTELEQDSPLLNAGVQIGDVILEVNGITLTDGNTWSDASYQLRSEQEQRLVIRRDTERQVLNLVFPPVERESYASVSVEYDFITSDYGVRQRTIATFPESATRLPAIFLVQGLSCSSIEYTPGRTSNFIKSLQYLIENSGMFVLRVEKPGVGDSDGRCSQTDFATELNGYEVALKTLLADPRIDPTKVIVFGSSMGGVVAPYLVNKYELNGSISDGPYYRSWFEHMLEIERRIKTMQGKSQSEVNQMMIQAYIPLYYGMLIEKKTYQEVIEQQPLLAEYNYHGPKHMYGRPMAFYHQMQDFDVAGNWDALKAPVRVRWGTKDWIMSEYDIDMIARVFEANEHPDSVVFKFPGLDHWDTIHTSELNSFQGQPGQWVEEIGKQIVDWAKEINR